MNSPLLHRFHDYINAHHLFAKDHHLMLAVSGGVDSVVLCDLCAKGGFSFSLAHCNFGLRGAESDRDEAFVADLARQWGVPFFLKRFATKAIAEESKGSIQEVARKLRYDWFAELLEQKGMPQQEADGQVKTLNYLLTAHHLDDNIETVLMNFFKGTGITGLRGMLPKQHKIVRPLLFAHRSEIEAYANENGLSWMHDSSNDKTEYTRNYFRHTVIPAVQTVFPEAVSNLGDNLQRFADAEQLYQQAIALHKKKLLEQKGVDVHIPVLKLAKAQPLKTIVYEILKDYGFRPGQTAEALRLLESESGRYITSPTHRLLRNRNWLILSPLHAPESTTIVLQKEDRTVLFADRKLSISTEKQVPAVLPTDPEIALLDASEIKYPLILRPWKSGDYLYPLGMHKKKKLSRFFIDRKLSKGEKEKIWVVESHKKIIWVIGLRIDDRFKVTANTTHIIRFMVSPV